jgi:hypothetical protein
MAFTLADPEKFVPVIATDVNAFGLATAQVQACMTPQRF